MRKDIAILYATMTGNARDCAEKTAGLLEKAGAPARLRDLAQYNPRDLLEETTVLLIISTWGDGEPPDDGVDFFDYVRGLEPSSLAHLRFAVFALGDTGYENFCQCGRDLDSFFEKHGAERCLERVDNDVDFEETLQNWHRDVRPAGACGGGLTDSTRPRFSSGRAPGRVAPGARYRF